MPRPPILEAVDWPALISRAQTFAQWIAAAENPAHAAQMRDRLAAIRIPPALAGFLAAMPRDVHAVAIAEDWCGDVVRHIPVLQAMAAHAPRLRVHYIARADSPDLFARFLTNGGEAIPKIVFLNDRLVECGNWGPMPADCRRLIARGKAAGDVGAARKKVALLYEADPNGDTALRELADLLDIALCTQP